MKKRSELPVLLAAASLTLALLASCGGGGGGSPTEPTGPTGPTDPTGPTGPTGEGKAEWDSFDWDGEDAVWQ